jgi:hypothetical protein
MTEVQTVVFVIDDDPSMRAALEDLIGSVPRGRNPRAGSLCSVNVPE